MQKAAIVTGRALVYILSLHPARTTNRTTTYITCLEKYKVLYKVKYKFYLVTDINVNKMN